MIATSPDSRVARPAQQAHIDDRVVPTKAARLASLLSDAEVRRAVGSAWPLYLMLVLAWGGTATGAKDEIAARIRADGRNVGNWVASMEAAGLVKVERIGRRMSVALTGAHMDAARIADPVVAVEATEAADDDPELAKLVTIYKAAKTAGARLRLLTESEFESGKPA